MVDSRVTLTQARLNDMAKSIELRGTFSGIKISLKETPYESECIEVLITWEVKDIISAETIPLMNRSTMSLKVIDFMGIKGLAQFIMHSVLSLIKHELEESFWFEGAQLVDPHPKVLAKRTQLG